MTYKELNILKRNMASFQDVVGTKFAIVLNRNMRRIDEALRGIEEEPSEEEREYEREKMKLFERYGVRDESGNLKLKDKGNGQRECVIEDEESFNDAVERLNEAYSEAIEKQRKRREELNQKLNEEADIELDTVSPDDLPEMSAKQIRAIEPMIHDVR